jgi:hypothetical protein
MPRCRKSTSRQPWLFVAYGRVRATAKFKNAVVFARRVIGIELAIRGGCAKRERSEHPAEELAAREIDDAVLLARGHHDGIPERHDFEEPPVEENLVTAGIYPHEFGMERTAVSGDAALPRSRPATGEIDRLGFGRCQQQPDRQHKHVESTGQGRGVHLWSWGWE